MRLCGWREPLSDAGWIEFRMDCSSFISRAQREIAFSDILPGHSNDRRPARQDATRYLYAGPTGETLFRSRRGERHSCAEIS
jgi:hypothetical protein